MLFFPALVFAQNTRLVHDTIFVSTGDTVSLSQVYVVPNTVVIEFDRQHLHETDYKVSLLEGKIIIKKSGIVNQAVAITYRYFTRFLNSAYALRTWQMVIDSAGDSVAQVIHPNYYKDINDFVEFGTLRKSGSISRGITVGSNQSLSVTSGLRLQVDGDLGDDIKIMAAITDENIPIQPEGTTQQISDFDKVFVQIIKGDNDILLGDYEINNSGTNFANFYRNVQGIGVNVNSKNFHLDVNGAVAKGKFFSNSFIGKDGVLGPYRLTGKNNERFIIVLAGSEKVYLNGKLAKRGEGNDYTIDYNTGELYFTAQQVITSAVRIVVDFEYSDRFYNRSLLFARSSAKAFDNKLDIRFSYGRDADNHNAPIDLSFSDEDRDSLRAAGDNDNLAYSSGVDTAGFLDGAIRYARVDTIINTINFERYIFSADPENAIYDLTFSFVGAGVGNYIKADNTVNGTVFEWVAPDSLGNFIGDYAPIKILVLPKLLQVVDIGLKYKINKKISVYTELALSSEDKNRFSALGDEDNFDLANKTGIQINNIRIKDSTRLKVDVSHKYIGERYTNLDRINKVEYGREWNFDDLGVQLSENVSEAIVQLDVKDDLTLRANVGYRSMGDSLVSFKQMYSIASQHKSIQGTYLFTSISTENKKLLNLSRWNRHNGNISKKFKRFQPGVEIWLEDKLDETGDSVSTGSFKFWDLKPYLKTVGSEKFNFYAYYNYRDEREQINGDMRNKSLAHTGYMKFIFSPISNFRLQNTSSYRDFQVLDSSFVAPGFEDSKTLVTNFQGNYFTKNKLVYTNLLYEVTSEQLARKEVAYIRVNPGQGQYVWVDNNEDGIEDLDEFQIGPNPLVADYSRILVPTQDLFPTTAINFSGNIKFDLKKIFKRSRNFGRELIRNFLSTTNFRISQKKESEDNIDAYLIDLKNVFADTTLLEAQYTLRQDFWFFRNNAKGDVKFSYADNKSKLFLSTGEELRGLQYYSSGQRVNFGKTKSLENEVKIGEKVSKADQLESRNYDIKFFELSPKVNWQLSRKVRLSLGYQFKDKQNLNDSLDVVTTVNIHKAILDAKINFKGRNNIFSKLELVQVSSTGEANFSTDYELKESLQEGFNAIWQVFMTYYLSENIEFSLTYDGRASVGNPFIHSGRIQIKAFF